MPQLLQFPDVVPDLVGESVHLRELAEEDIPAWFSRATDVGSADLAGDPVPESMDAGALWLQRQRHLFHAKAGLRWAIVPSGLAGSVGTVGLTITSTVQRTAELGIVIARAHWGKGIGTSAAHLLKHYAFSTLGLAQVHAEVLQRNPASVRMLEKAGFRRVRVKPPTAAEPETLVLLVLSAGDANAA